MTVIKDSKVGEAAAWPIPPKGDMPENFSVGFTTFADINKRIMIELFGKNPEHGYVWHEGDGTTKDYRIEDFYDCHGMHKIIFKIDPIMWVLTRDNPMSIIRWTTSIHMDAQGKEVYRGDGRTGPQAVIEATMQLLDARKQCKTD